MKRILNIFLVAALAVGCSQKPDLINPKNFEGEVDGAKTDLYTLKGGDLTMQVTNYGGRVVALFVPDKDGNLVDVVLGHNTLDEYVHYKKERFLGSVVGPVANRICGASFTVDSVTYKLSANHGGKGTLHGGFKGLDSVVWDVKDQTDSSITLHYLHPDGQEGFPGNLDIEMTYTLSDNDSWKIDYKAITDKTTPVNISNHPFFNLSGEGNGTCLDYIVYINGYAITGIDGLDIIEQPIPVKGTAFDYTTPHPVRDAVESDDVQIVRGNHGFDHNYCLNRQGEGLTLDASVYDPESGIFLEVLSDQPGLQAYSGQYFDGSEIGKSGKPYGKYASITFETQNYPDAPNKQSFPNPYLRPGETYIHHCVYRFSVK